MDGFLFATRKELRRLDVGQSRLVDATRSKREIGRDGVRLFARFFRVIKNEARNRDIPREPARVNERPVRVGKYPRLRAAYCRVKFLCASEFRD